VFTDPFGVSETETDEAGVRLPVVVPPKVPTVLPFTFTVKVPESLLV